MGHKENAVQAQPLRVQIDPGGDGGEQRIELRGLRAQRRRRARGERGFLRVAKDLFPLRKVAI